MNIIKRGVSKRWINHDEEVIADFTKAIEINPNDANVFYYRATIKFKLLDYSEEMI
jgi:hypothetical protein